MTTHRRIPWLLTGLLLSAALIVVLAWQNRGLREQQAELQKRAFEPYAGTFVPEVRATTLDGEAVRLGAPPQRLQVLYFFTPACPYCRQSAPAVRELADRLAQRSADVQILGVADGKAGEVRRYAAEHRFRFPIVPMRDHRTLAVFKANSVPTIVVIDAQGRVKHAHVGVLDGQGDAMAKIVAAVDSREQATAAVARSASR